MRFYFPDSQDQIDPNFDFEHEEHPLHHVRQRDDLYAHEALGEPASTGILVSMGAGRYTMAQRHRFERVGIREFFRLDGMDGPRIETLGDCGAFSYVNEPEPPYTVEQVISFYHDAGFDAGISVDHVIAGFQADCDHTLPGLDAVPEDWVTRYEITLDRAEAFLCEHRSGGYRFEPVGAAQGWSPHSYKDAVNALQTMGYRRIALGGLVGLKTPEILRVLSAANEVRSSDVEFHLLGVTRIEHVTSFKDFGVTSIDSTSPFRQSFKDARDNYHGFERNFVAVRIPQVDGNLTLKRLIGSGEVDLGAAQRLERACLDGVRAYAYDDGPLAPLLEALHDYQALYKSKRDHTAAYQETLESRPWESCPCAICRDVGVEVVLFRGSERNKRRGFHNTWVFNQRLQSRSCPDKALGIDGAGTPSVTHATPPPKS